MSAMTHIRNPHAVMAILRRAKPALAAPVFPADTDAIARATSLLIGMEFADETRHPNTLTPDQARDVIAWATSRIL